MKLKDLRVQSKLTQEEFGKIIGQTKSNISKYENGLLEPSIETLKQIAEYFNVTIDYLLEKSSDPKFSRKDEIDIAKEIDKINESLENTDELMFHGEILDEETRELLKKSLENTIYFSKILAKEKFNPNKNKKNNDSND